MSVGTVFKDIWKSTGGPSRWGSVLEEPISAVEREAAAIVNAAFGAQYAVEADSIGTVIGEMTGWGIILLIAGFLIIMRFVEHTLVGLAGIWPAWLGRSKIIWWIHLEFSPLDALDNWLVARADDALVGIAKAFVRAVRNAVLMVFPELAHLNVSKSGSGIRITWREWVNTQAAINHLNMEVKALQQSINGIRSPSTGLRTVDARLTRLEDAERVIVHDLNVLHSQVQHALNTQGANATEIAQMVHELTAVRALTLGVEDLLQDTQTEVNTLRTNLARTATQTEKNTHTLTTLSPLAHLLIYGTIGLRNLQKLEKNPCQCRGFGGLNIPQAEFLAMYEFLTNG